MAEQDDIIARIRVLEDIENIKKMKFRYWRGVNRKQWDLFIDQFAEGCEIDVAGQIYHGREAVLQFAKGMYGGDNIVSFHQGHNADINVTSETTATGIWIYNLYRYDRQTNTGQQGSGYYEDEYIKEDGKWRHKSIKVGGGLSQPLILASAAEQR